MMQLTWKHNAEIILNQLTLLQLINSASFFLYIVFFHRNTILLVRNSSTCRLKHAEIYSFPHTVRAETCFCATFG